MSVITFEPPTLHLNLYAGDGARLEVSTAFARPGYGAFMFEGEIDAQIRSVPESDEALLDWTVDAERAAEGVFVLTLTGEQIESLLRPRERVRVAYYDVQWSPPDNEPITVLQGRVRCIRDVTRTEPRRLVEAA